MTFTWHWALALGLWYAGLYIVQQSQHRRAFWIGWGCMLASLLWLVGLLAYSFDLFKSSGVVFYLLAAAFTFLTSGILITLKNPVYVALTFALSILGVGTLLLFNGAAFLMAGVFIIYAGAIVVTFLFIIMLAQQKGPARYDAVPREPFLACLAGWALSIATAWTISSSHPSSHVKHSDDIYSTDHLQKVIAGLEAALQDLKKALELLRPREELVEILDVKQFTGIVLTRDIETLHRPIMWNKEKAILERRKELEEAYESLLQAIREEPIDYNKAKKATERLGIAVTSYGNLIHGAQVVTAMKDESPTRGLGKALYGYYYIPIQLAGVLLLLATIGSLIIGKPGIARS